MMKMRMKTAWALALVMVMAYWSAHVVDSGRDGRESEGGEARDRTAEKNTKRGWKARQRKVSPNTARWVPGVGCQRAGWACQKFKIESNYEICELIGPGSRHLAAAIAGARYPRFQLLRMCRISGHHNKQ
jgi:hypothetical protein